jgi:DNA-binding LacI/PurR family transcriptional regulator
VAALPVKDVSRRAVQLLEELIENPKLPPRVEVIDEHLVVVNIALPREGCAVKVILK